MRLLLVLPTLFLLSACYAHNPSSVRVDGVGEVRYDNGHHHHHHGHGKGGNFCPPGQGKKHKC